MLKPLTTPVCALTVAAEGFVLETIQLYPLGASTKSTLVLGKQIDISKPASGIVQLAAQFCVVEAITLHPCADVAVSVTICPLGIPVTVFPESTPLSD